ncbi:PP2C family serine/threonine-protein phosphatase [Gloeothece verrucosa]|uniref:Protein serine/threonine phosphatase n=1 Tax=Gloeothece verrucosa (strain PCC 7822) TaxID=497965 RepID=E0UJE1_GLOV7|nr:PP2C family serine/threonine-protein phosphatase [Gloeothece verrucosa]ADN16959.1 protein serine/threonine phosphatase [Gloeothece verrucosa PCC 7822]
MVDKQKTTDWRVLFASVRGSSHERQNLPNQDAIALWQPSALKLPLILAVSDGHGSAKSFRSEIGSQLAVEIAISCLRGLIEPESSLDKLAQESQLSKQIVTAWRKAVNAHLEQEAFNEQEIAKLREKGGNSACQSLEHNPLLAYGATLLAVLVTEDFILYLQLGDGDILCVSPNGVIRRPFSEDKNLIANETYSLCMKEAWQYFRWRIVPLDEPPPMILVATDGYSNSFADEADFIQIGRDYLELIRSEGSEQVAQDLETFLAATSRGGSGDDITLGIIKKLDERDIIDTLKILKAALQEYQQENETLSQKIASLEASKQQESVNTEIVP